MHHIAPRVQDARLSVCLMLHHQEQRFCCHTELTNVVPSIWHVLLSQHGVAEMHVASSLFCWMTIAEMPKSVGKQCSGHQRHH